MNISFLNIQGWSSNLEVFRKPWCVLSFLKSWQSRAPGRTDGGGHSTNLINVIRCTASHYHSRQPQTVELSSFPFTPPYEVLVPPMEMWRNKEHLNEKFSSISLREMIMGMYRDLTATCWRSSESRGTYFIAGRVLVPSNPGHICNAEWCRVVQRAFLPSKNVVPTYKKK